MGFIDAPSTDDANTAAYFNTVGWVLLMLLVLLILILLLILMLMLPLLILLYVGSADAAIYPVEASALDNLLMLVRVHMRLGKSHF